MASSSFILGKVMDAMRDALRARAFDWIDAERQIQSGLTAGPLDTDGDAEPDSTPTPNITCEASQASVVVPNIATFRVECVVHIASSADSEQSDGERTTYLDHIERSGQVLDYIFDPAFPAAMNNDGLTVFGIYQTDQSLAREGRTWITRMSFYIECAGSSIS